MFMQREQIIEALVVDSLVSIFDRNQYCWLQGVLENGFRGFAQMSTEELLMEMQHRKLDAALCENADKDIDFDDNIGGPLGIVPMNTRPDFDDA
jgi:hypothetical protein